MFLVLDFEDCHIVQKILDNKKQRKKKVENKEYCGSQKLIEDELKLVNRPCLMKLIVVSMEIVRKRDD